MGELGTLPNGTHNIRTHLKTFPALTNCGFDLKGEHFLPGRKTVAGQLLPITKYKQS